GNRVERHRVSLVRPWLQANPRQWPRGGQRLTAWKSYCLDLRNMAAPGYFLVADVLGFGRIVDNSSESELDQRIGGWTSLVESTAATHGIIHFQLVSDTLFVAEPSSEAGLANLLNFSIELLSAGVLRSLPVRGAIVHDSYEWGKLTYGRAVIAAHQLEQAQNWIGITCASGLPAIDRFWSIDCVVCYPPPLKRAPMQLHPVLAWDVPDSGELLRLLVGGGLVKEREVLTWELGEKANNTALFGLYLAMLRENALDCSKFHGSLPVQAIEAGYRLRT
ncbi:MAG: hypothetical protein ACRES7_03655, partial [Gammaproteobacteria bacterium]